MNIPTIHPQGLKKDDTIVIVAPAGPVRSRDALDESAAAFERMGFRIRYDRRIFQSDRYLAGSDTDRAEELMRAFEDDTVKAIVGLRGGYGCSRLIPHLDKERLRTNPKVFMGFSDLTTLHLFFYRHFGWITIHGPMAVNPGIGKYPADQESHLLSLWTDPEYRPKLNFPQLEALAPGKAEGRLAGGCLSTIIAGIGTPYEIDTEGTILLLEDIGEPPYRIDRMLTQLEHSGKLHSLAGILLGEFFNCEPEEAEYASRDIFKEILQKLDIPVLANFPAGHGENNWALPLGARVRIDTDTRSLEFLEAAVC